MHIAHIHILASSITSSHQASQAPTSPRKYMLFESMSMLNMDKNLDMDEELKKVDDFYENLLPEEYYQWEREGSKKVLLHWIVACPSRTNTLKILHDPRALFGSWMLYHMLSRAEKSPSDCRIVARRIASFLQLQNQQEHSHPPVESQGLKRGSGFHFEDISIESIVEFCIARLEVVMTDHDGIMNDGYCTESDEKRKSVVELVRIVNETRSIQHSNESKKPRGDIEVHQGIGNEKGRIIENIITGLHSIMYEIRSAVQACQHFEDLWESNRREFGSIPERQKATLIPQLFFETRSHNGGSRWSVIKETAWLLHCALYLSQIHEYPFDHGLQQSDHSMTMRGERIQCMSACIAFLASGGKTNHDIGEDDKDCLTSVGKQSLTGVASPPSKRPRLDLKTRVGRRLALSNTIATLSSITDKSNRSAVPSPTAKFQTKRTFVLDVVALATQRAKLEIGESRNKSSRVASIDVGMNITRKDLEDELEKVEIFASEKLQSPMFGISIQEMEYRANEWKKELETLIARNLGRERETNILFVHPKERHVYVAHDAGAGYGTTTVIRQYRSDGDDDNRLLELNDWTETLLVTSAHTVRPSQNLATLLGIGDDSLDSSVSVSDHSIEASPSPSKTPPGDGDWENVIVQYLNITLDRLVKATSTCRNVLEEEGGEIESSQSDITVGKNGELQCHGNYLFGEKKTLICKETLARSLIALYYSALEATLSRERARSQSHANHKKLAANIHFHKGLISACLLCLSRATSATFFDFVCMYTKTSSINTESSTEMKRTKRSHQFIFDIASCCAYDYLKISETFVQSMTSDSVTGSIRLPFTLVRNLARVEEELLQIDIWETEGTRSDDSFTCNHFGKFVTIVEECVRRGVDGSDTCRNQWPPPILCEKRPKAKGENHSDDERAEDRDMICLSGLQEPVNLSNEFTFVNYVISKILLFAARRIGTMCKKLEGTPGSERISYHAYGALRHILCKNVKLLYNRQLEDIISCLISGVCKVMSITSVQRHFPTKFCHIDVLPELNMYIKGHRLSDDVSQSPSTDDDKNLHLQSVVHTSVQRPAYGKEKSLTMRPIKPVIRELFTFGTVAKMV